MHFSSLLRYSKYIVRVSRPPFWLYLAGPVLIGLTNRVDLYSLYLLLYFVFPANIFLYGINDLWDHDTDALNPKKISREVLTTSFEEKKILKIAVLLSMLLSIPLVIFGSTLVQLLIGLFFFLSYYYSAPPIRFKARPFLDSGSNFLYIIPGLIAYVYTQGTLPAVSIIIAASMWTWAMHLFSAIPDIEPDKKAGIQTTAVVLGKQKSLLLCVIYWSLATYFVASFSVLLSIGLIYVLIPTTLFIVRANSHKIAAVYWKYPLLNGFIGLGLYFYMLMNL